MSLISLTFFKFIIDEEGEVRVKADFLLMENEKEVAEILVSVMFKLLDALDDGLLKKIKKVQWA